MTKETGGPAFPIQGFSTRSGQSFQAVMADGMTLRDYFAAKAMHFCLKNSFTTAGAIERAYEIADLMLEARK